MPNGQFNLHLHPQYSIIMLPGLITLKIVQREVAAFELSCSFILKTNN